MISGVSVSILPGSQFTDDGLVDPSGTLIASSDSVVHESGSLITKDGEVIIAGGKLQMK